MSTAEYKAVFLSYASQDAEAAKKIPREARARGGEKIINALKTILFNRKEHKERRAAWVCWAGLLWSLGSLRFIAAP